MPARDLAEPYPHVTTDDPAVDAARLLAEQNLPALLVLDTDGIPYAVVPGSQVVGQLVPEYVMEDPLLAAVIDERHADASPRHWRAGRSRSGCRAGRSTPCTSARTRAYSRSPP
ncbi:hypothetical protein Snoj_42260 [Streptomyces nojiriensis]|uniref:CBS domain-containing protein n=1 Tax=Streptomyces nojiriensis TaxID=66374 RepID=A0ABQ3SQ89_9ACTN|nr:hypothetical protein [Streptomyces nojiriensis]QTI43843.1 hypothetical protein JYK04_01606 [Streptomyces nojiriensis]GGR84128.1 hypothetical protein GCM10010205_10920 [Streptomyces nojiriensis]GHI70308.1 hypothetical protein Snoj_42260 [Streptomyces nojiriensis]